jgi:hypothetical protein
MLRVFVDFFGLVLCHYITALKAEKNLRCPISGTNGHLSKANDVLQASFVAFVHKKKSEKACALLSDT